MQEVRTTYRCSTFPQTAKQHSASTIPNTPDSNKTQNQTVLKKKVRQRRSESAEERRVEETIENLHASGGDV